ncbi:MAG: META domain-containing protein [Prevotella sp.]|nr:META domain-containing protein [Bacteroides sp.]MCM1366080.1 META domain-containing protein [Prevotella sp.]MCM1436565.1 META domain-containing protein [Prevotella sp.]
MYKRLIYCAVAFFATTVMLSSCSMLQGTSGASKTSTTKTKKKKKGAVLPLDREQLMIDKTAKTYTPEELAKGIVKGDWAIEEVNGKVAKGENAPFLKFVATEKRVYGNNGCNVINATYTYNPKDSTMSFANLASTMMDCYGLEGTDLAINQALTNTAYYRWRLEGSQYYLYFFDSKHNELMQLMHQNFDFLNGTWQVLAIEEETIDNPDMKIVIDVEEGYVHGNTGCNILNGKLEIDMDSPNSISFSSIGLTRMACPGDNMETPFIVALEGASYARPISPEKVLLLDDQHRVVLELARTSDK